MIVDEEIRVLFNSILFDWKNKGKEPEEEIESEANNVDDV